MWSSELKGEGNVSNLFAKLVPAHPVKTTKGMKIDIPIKCPSLSLKATIRHMKAKLDIKEAFLPYAIPVNIILTMFYCLRFQLKGQQTRKAADKSLKHFKG